MAIEVHVFKLSGITPLLQSNPACMTSSEGDSLTAKKKTYDNNEEAKIRTYQDSDGKFVHPTAALRSAILEACKGRKIGKRGAKVAVAGAVFPAETSMVICDEKGKPATKFAVHTCRVKIGKAGIIRARPMWEKWTAMVPFEIDTDFIDVKMLEELLNIAGRIVGIGEFRPDTSGGKTGVGSFGRFRAQLNK